jgi:hypothetical protein
MDIIDGVCTQNGLDPLSSIAFIRLLDRVLRAKYSKIMQSSTPQRKRVATYAVEAHSQSTWGKLRGRHEVVKLCTTVR